MSLDRYRSLEALARGAPISTSQAAARLRVPMSQASRLLGRLSDRGLALRIRPGLWHLGEGIPDRLMIASALTSPAPAYVSFVSALSYWGVIDQTPMEISVASTAHPRTIHTSLGRYVVHRIPPALFAGWIDDDGRSVATIAKALFDSAYIAAARKRRVSLPELDLPPTFEPAEATAWLANVQSGQLRTLTGRTLEKLLNRAINQSAPYDWRS